MPNEENKALWPSWETLGLENRTLSTERLLLTAPTAGDAPALTRIQNTDFVLRYNAMELWDEERMRGWIEKNAARQIVLRRREDATPIGLVGLAEDSLRYGVDSVELNCYLAEDYARQGYMREALAVSWTVSSTPARSGSPPGPSRLISPPAACWRAWASGRRDCCAGPCGAMAAWFSTTPSIPSTELRGPQPGMGGNRRKRTDRSSSGLNAGKTIGPTRESCKGKSPASLKPSPGGEGVAARPPQAP